MNGTINSARDGGEQVKAEANVSHWNTPTLSGGERLQVLAAEFANKAGWAIDVIGN